MTLELHVLAQFGRCDPVMITDDHLLYHSVVISRLVRFRVLFAKLALRFQMHFMLLFVYVRGEIAGLKVFVELHN